MGRGETSPSLPRPPQPPAPPLASCGFMATARTSLPSGRSCGSSSRREPPFWSSTIRPTALAERPVPAARGKAVAAAAAGPVEVVLIHGAGHNDTYDLGGRAYRDKLWEFVAGRKGGRAGT